MTVTIVNCAQRSEEWFAARAGRVTGSRAADVLAKIKTGEAAARRDYRLQLAVERLTGRPMEDGGFVSAEMQRGIDLEPKARQVFMEKSGLEVRETGFVIRDDLSIGCSTDGDVGSFTEIVEIKCPKSWTHIEYLRGKRLPPKYAPQVMHNLLVTGAERCHFISYDDRLPPYLDYFHVIVERSELDLTLYDAELRKFLADVDDEYQSLLLMKAA